MTELVSMGNASIDPKLILSDAVDMEIQGTEFYGRAAERMTNKRGKEMFLSLVKQEKSHAEILEDQLKTFSQGGSWRPLQELRGRSTSRISVFEDNDIKKINLRQNAGELEVILVGVEVEKKSVEYYQTAGRAIEDKRARELFNWLVAQEAGHQTILQAEYDYRTKSGFYMGNPEFSLEVE